MDDIAPSPWVRRFAVLIRPGGRILDVACGFGRHARMLAGMGYVVEAVDHDAQALASLSGLPGVDARLADLESERWPYGSGGFDAVVVTNYLFRPHFASLLATLGPRGLLIYETFMAGNERLGRPSNPDFLLQPGELLERVRGHLSVVAFEQGRVEIPKPAFVQRICAVAADLGALP
jgi:SAM-dependent methyltransferase